ncbi:DUF536 domain-containing protein [Enterococcus sp. LJL120]
MLENKNLELERKQKLLGQQQQLTLGPTSKLNNSSLIY